MKRWYIGAALFIATVALAGPIKVWVAGETITASDINANFAHIHNLMVGSHGARLVNADVSASAAIAHSKLATPALLPKAIGARVLPCDGGTCTWNVNSGFTSTFVRTFAGQYTLTLVAARPVGDYIANVQLVADGVNDYAQANCWGQVATPSTISVLCARTVPDGGSFRFFADAPFSVTVFDNDN